MEDEIDLRDLFYYIYKHRKLVATATIVGLVLGILLYGVSYFLYASRDQYAITSTIAVTTQNKGGYFTSNGANPNSTDIHLAEDMVDSVIYVCGSDTVLQAAAEELRLLGTRPEDIRKNLSFKQYKDTQIIQLQLVWYNEDEGIQILNAINHVLPTELIDVLKLGSVSVINQPKATVYFQPPMKPMHIALITFLFAGAAIAVCFLELLLHPTLTNVEDVQRDFQTDLYGVIPKDPSYENRRGMFADDTYRQNPVLEEAFSSAAYTLAFQMSEKEHPVVCITSSVTREGKTSLVANLGRQLAKQHHKVLLVDFDLRKPSLAGLFMNEPEYSHSLNSVLRWQVNPRDAVVHLNEHLDILPTFLEKNLLFFSPMVATMIRDLAQDYDMVLIDTAPVGQVADTLFIKKFADEILYVIGYDEVWQSVIRSNMNKLRGAGIDVCGCIVNQVDKMGYQDMQYYSHYYGDQYKAESTRLVADRETGRGGRNADRNTAGYTGENGDGEMYPSGSGMDDEMHSGRSHSGSRKDGSRSGHSGKKRGGKHSGRAGESGKKGKWPFSGRKAGFVDDTEVPHESTILIATTKEKEEEYAMLHPEVMMEATANASETAEVAEAASVNAGAEANAVAGVEK